MAPTLAIPTCRCCGSASVRLWGAKQGRVLPGIFRYYHCSACGFRFVDPVTQSDIYNDDYYNGVGIDPYVDYVGELQTGSPREQEFRDLERLVGRFRFSVKDRMRWLDYGCGTGSLLRHFDGRCVRTTGGPVTIQAEGCDVGSYAVRLSEEGYSIKDYAELERPAEATYDVISAIEVIEHLPDPLHILGVWARLLKPGGLLVLTTGNMDSPIARKDGLHYRYLIPEIHVSLFSPQSLGLLYRRVGLRPVNVRYDGVVKYKVVRSLLNRERRRVAAAGLRLPLVTRVIDWAFGVSAMPWGRKPD